MVLSGKGNFRGVISGCLSCLGRGVVFSLFDGVGYFFVVKGGGIVWEVVGC